LACKELMLHRLGHHALLLVTHHSPGSTEEALDASRGIIIITDADAPLETDILSKNPS